MHKIYTSEALRLIENHTAYIHQAVAGVGTSLLERRYYDLIHGTEPEQEEPPEKQAQEVKNRFINAFQ